MGNIPNLHKKILLVMKDVGYIQKDGKVDFNKIKYNVVTEEKVTTTVRASLVEHGLTILPVAQTTERSGMLTSVDVVYQITDTETGESIQVASSGQGVDTQDKGVGKAMTYAYKYMLLRSFAIPTGEDPDKISSAELDETERLDAENREMLIQNIQELSDITGSDFDKTVAAVNKKLGLPVTNQVPEKMFYQQALRLIKRKIAEAKKKQQPKPPSEQLPKGTEKQETLL